MLDLNDLWSSVLSDDSLFITHYFELCGELLFSSNYNSVVPDGNIANKDDDTFCPYIEEKRDLWKFFLILIICFLLY